MWRRVDIDALFVLTLLAIAAIGILMLLMRVTLAWVARWAARHSEARFRAVEQIANGGPPPEAWLRPYRQKLEHLRSTGAGAAEVERLGRTAQRHCLRELDHLIHFLKEGSFYDSPESKLAVLEDMQEQRARWAAQPWQALIQWPP